jgi:phosphoribosylanthranilate isomerase
VRATRPYGVDVASGVEVSPGVKDADAVRAFVRAVKTLAWE